MIDVQSFIQKKIPKTKLSKQRTESLVDALLELRLLYIEENEQKEHYKNLFLNVANENTKLVTKCMDLEKSQNNCDTNGTNEVVEQLKKELAEKDSEISLLKKEVSKLVETQSSKAGRKRKVDQSYFNKLISEGYSMDQVMNELQISRATYFRMKTRKNENNEFNT